MQYVLVHVRILIIESEQTPIDFQVFKDTTLQFKFVNKKKKWKKKSYQHSHDTCFSYINADTHSN